MRQISIPIYIAAFVVTTLVFFAGIYVGKSFDEGAMNSFSRNIDSLSQRLSSSELLFLLEDSPSYCPIFQEELGKMDADTETLGKKLTYMENDKGVADPELKRGYFLLELKSYILTEKVRDRCKTNSTALLYFYSNKNCSDCGRQGDELTKLKQKMGEGVKIYSFDGELGGSVVEALKKDKNVTQYPTVVLDGKKMEGVVDSNLLISTVRNNH